ncbi:MAG TPA: hypothetical protein VLN74_10280, partial [Ilumatobacteraceae bacterium]|nr:hypothetical protein [Ilumatobacteraceae bacterium]
MTDTTTDTVDDRDEEFSDEHSPDAGDGDAPESPRQRRHPRTPADRIVDIVVAFICFAVGTAWTFNPFRTQFTGGTFA